MKTMKVAIILVIALIAVGLVSLRYSSKHDTKKSKIEEEAVNFALPHSEWPEANNPPVALKLYPLENLE